jgi:hypothetical protein
VKPFRLAHAIAFGALVALVSAGCGGATSTGGGAKSEDEAAGSKSKKGGGSDRDGEGEGDEEPAASTPASRCADGTCFECGAGLCPKGFYCDEGAPGGAACGWLPECAASPSCGCVKQGLGSACNCEERSSGLFVKCN